MRDMLAASHDVHAAPTEVKESLYLDRADSGYMPIGSNTRWGSDGQVRLFSLVIAVHGCSVSVCCSHCACGGDCVAYQPPLPVYEGVNEGYLLWGYGPPWVPDAHQLATLEDNQWPDEQTLPGFTVRKRVL